MTATAETTTPSEAPETAGTRRMRQAERERIREFLRKLREANPKMKLAEGQRRAEQRFGVKFTSSFGPTFWRRSAPDEPTQPASVQPEEENGASVRIDALEDGYARLRVDIEVPAAQAWAAAAALSSVLAQTVAPGGAAALRVLSDGATVAASSIRSDLLD